MIVPGGTPSVIPLSVASSTGRPPAVTVGFDEPGSVETTTVQGFVLGLGGWAHPTIGAPDRSPSHRTLPPWICTCICLGMSVTCPPCAQMMVALVVTIGGIVLPSPPDYLRRAAGGKAPPPGAPAWPLDVLSLRGPRRGYDRASPATGAAAMNVFVIDAHEIYRGGIVASLKDVPDVAVIGDVAGVAEARAHARLVQSDVVIIDHDVHGAHELLHDLSAFDGIRAIVCSASCGEERVLASMRAGAVGVLSKESLTPEALISAVHAGARGAGVLAPDLLDKLLTHRRVNGSAAPRRQVNGARFRTALTARELRVLSLIAAGRATREVAAELSYSERAVKSVLHSAVTKLHARSRAQAVAYAVRSGLI